MVSMIRAKKVEDSEGRSGGKFGRPILRTGYTGLLPAYQSVASFAILWSNYNGPRYTETLHLAQMEQEQTGRMRNPLQGPRHFRIVLFSQTIGTPTRLRARG